MCTPHLPLLSQTPTGSPISENFLTQETHRTTTKLLPRMNLSRNHPLALRYAPKNWGGLSLPHYYVIQGSLLVKQAIKHFRIQSTLGLNLHIHLQWTQHHTGLQTGILTDRHTDISYIANNWWTKVRKFLHHIHGEFQMEQEYIIPPLQTNNRSIMADILGVYRWQKKRNRGLKHVDCFFRSRTFPKLCQTGPHWISR